MGKETPAPIMTIAQVAEHTGLAELTLKRMARKGMIPAVKLGQKWRIKRDLFDKWLEEHPLCDLAEFE